MDNNAQNYQVYVRTDERGRIVEVNSSAWLTDTTGWTQIDEGSEWPKYPHAQGNYFPQTIYTEDGIPRYGLEDGEAAERSTAELAADRALTRRLVRIAECKAQLEATDYRIIKCAEYALAGLEAPYDLAALHAERQALRDEINELEGGGWTG